MRLLPLVVGLMLGALPAARVVRSVGAKIAVAAGFVLLAAGLLLGSTMSLGSGGLFVAAWLALAGLGTGIAILGSVLTTGHLARFDLSGLPVAAAAAARQSVFGGVAAAQELHSPALLTVGTPGLRARHGHGPARLSRDHPRRPRPHPFLPTPDERREEAAGSVNEPRR